MGLGRQPRGRTGKPVLGRVFRFLYEPTIRKTALSGGFLLFLNFLVDFARPGIRIELLKLDFTLYFLLVFAATTHVPGSRAKYDETILGHR